MIFRLQFEDGKETELILDEAGIDYLLNGLLDLRISASGTRLHTPSLNSDESGSPTGVSDFYLVKAHPRLEKAA